MVDLLQLQSSLDSSKKTFFEQNEASKGNTYTQQEMELLEEHNVN